MSEVAKIEKAKTNTLPATSQSGQMLTFVAEAARDTSIDLDRVERMLAIQERMLEQERRTAFDEARARMQAELPTVVKTQENTQTRSKYADWGDINQQVQPIYSAHGFSLSFSPGEIVQGMAELSCTLSYGGYRETTTMRFPLDDSGPNGTKNKTPIQALASTITYAKRILGCAVLNITVAGEDRDGNAAPSFDDSQWIARIEAVTSEGYPKLRDDLKEVRGSMPHAVYQKLAAAMNEKRATFQAKMEGK